MHSGDIEVILSRFFGCRVNTIVPNVSYGLNIHEVDLLIVSHSGYASEVEIKTSVSDLKADLKKSHGHRSNKIKYLYFAVPLELKEKALELIPERAGLIVITPEKLSVYSTNPPSKTPYVPEHVDIVKAPTVNKQARKLTEKELLKLGSLAAMRIWSLKERIYRYQREYKAKNNEI